MKDTYPSGVIHTHTHTHTHSPGTLFYRIKVCPAFVMDILLFDFVFNTAGICSSLRRFGRPRVRAAGPGGDGSTALCSR